MKGGGGGWRMRAFGHLETDLLRARVQGAAAGRRRRGGGGTYPLVRVHCGMLGLRGGLGRGVVPCRGRSCVY